MTNAAQSEWFAIAQLLRSQGRRGELLAEPLTDLDVFHDGREVFLVSSGEPTASTPARLLEAHFFPTGRNAGRIVLKLSGSESITDAEALEGQHLFIPASSLPALEEGTWFVRDLIGSTLFDRGNAAGTIVDIQFPVGSDGRRLEDAPSLLEVETAPDTETVLIPLVLAWIESVDAEARAVRMNLPDGLLATEA
ncbi:MAG: ribosome maturation factor RimM [Acidobacteriaceae bacterium]|nr:ribosome maturation factor RimM [Acidobacteriaceae bacterium]